MSLVFLINSVLYRVANTAIKTYCRKNSVNYVVFHNLGSIEAKNDIQTTELENDILNIPNATVFRETCLSQEFPIPITLMKYIWANPSSPKIYQKLVQCCKLFFIKNPIVVIKRLHHCCGYYGDGWKYETGKKGRYCRYDLKAIDIDKIKSKIWITKRFCVSTKNLSKLATNLIPKIFRFDVEEIRFSNQNLFFNELKFFSSNVKNVCIEQCVITYNNGEDVPVENVMKAFSNCKKFKISIPKPNLRCDNYGDLVDACNRMEEIDICIFQTTFNVLLFFEELKIRKNRALITLRALEPTPHLNQISNEIFDTETFDYVPPVIFYFLERRYIKIIKKMEQIQAREAAKYH